MVGGKSLAAYLMSFQPEAPTMSNNTKRVVIMVVNSQFTVTVTVLRWSYELVPYRGCISCQTVIRNYE